MDMEIMDIEAIAAGCAAFGRCDADRRQRGQRLAAAVLDALVGVMGERMRGVVVVWGLRDNMILYIATDERADGASIAVPGRLIPCATEMFQGFARLCVSRGLEVTLDVDGGV
jgi:hypothetical protein